MRELKLQSYKTYPQAFNFIIFTWSFVFLEKCNWWGTFFSIWGWQHSILQTPGVITLLPLQVFVEHWNSVDSYYRSRTGQSFMCYCSKLFGNSGRHYCIGYIWLVFWRLPSHPMSTRDLSSPAFVLKQALKKYTQELQSWSKLISFFFFSPDGFLLQRNWSQYITILMSYWTKAGSIPK